VTFRDGTIVADALNYVNGKTKDLFCKLGYYSTVTPYRVEKRVSDRLRVELIYLWE